MLDLVLRNGTVVDGTGADARQADVGIRGDRIVAIGKVDEPTRRSLDVEGRVISPGFIDVHTHFDAQLFWDPNASPSPLHGVTTVIGGNCGFGIAPIGPNQRDVFMHLMAKVEDIPLPSLERLEWDWSSMGDFLGKFEGRVGPNVGFFVGHSSVRIVTMGEASSERAATDDELQAMLALFDQSISEGGLGFSSSWSRVHVDTHGQPVPSRHGTEQELLAFARATGRHSGTSIEFDPPMVPFTEEQYSIMARMSSESGRTVSFIAGFAEADKADELENMLAAGDYAQARGGNARMQLPPAPVRFFMDFDAGIVFLAARGWPEALTLPYRDKLAFFNNPVERKRLEDAATAEAARGNTTARFFNWPVMRIASVCRPELRQYQGRLVSEIAAGQGKSAFDALVDISIADDFKTIFTAPTADSDPDWKACVSALRDPRTILGAADSGAHLRLIAQYGLVPELLANAVRQRQLMSLEEAVHFATDDVARYLGLRERGRLQEGWYADIAVFDAETIGTGAPYVKQDLPGGATRLFVEAEGIEHVLVNGQPLVTHGAFTDSRAGTVLRSGRDTQSETR